MGSRANRRTLLSGIAGVLPALLSGCSTTDDTPTSSPTLSPPSTGTPTRSRAPDTHSEHPTNTPTETPTDTPSPEPTPTPRPRRRLGFGNWYATDFLDYTVVGMELLTQFEHEAEDRTYEMPADEQLLVVTTRLRNDDAEPKGSGLPFVALVGPDVYTEQPEFSHPELGSVPTTVLPQVEHRRQFSSEGLVLEANETRTAWVVFVVPRGPDRKDVEVGYSYFYAEEHGYPVRWIPREGQ